MKDNTRLVIVGDVVERAELRAEFGDVFVRKMQVGCEEDFAHIAFPVIFLMRLTGPI